MAVSNQYKLSKENTLKLLDTLRTASGQAQTFYIPPGLLQDVELPKSELYDLPKEISSSVARSKTGAVLFFGEEQNYIILPPFPIGEYRAINMLLIEPLQLHLEQERVIALIFVRLGAYAIGVFRDETLLSSKVGTGNIHARHKKGGSSQRRFERHREKQIEQFFDRVCNHVQERIGPYMREIDYAIYSGESNTMRSFRRQCSFLQPLDDHILETALNIREPRQYSLEAAIKQVWSSTVIRLNQE